MWQTLRSTLKHIDNIKEKKVKRKSNSVVVAVAEYLSEFVKFKQAPLALDICNSSDKM